MKVLMSSLLHLLLLLLLYHCPSYSSKSGSNVVSIANQKEFKKLLRTKNNVLVHYAFGDEIQGLRDLLSRVSASVKGLATVAEVNCNAEAKLCKKLSKVEYVSPSSSQVLKHYRNGVFHLDYTRALQLESLVHFLKDPTGDMPWEEEPLAQDILHLGQPSALNKLIQRDPQEKILIMFYAPWCGFCKRLKPRYQKAASAVASEIRGAVMAAMDVNKPVNAPIRQKYNITAFPTILFFEGGEMRYAYPGENEVEAYVSFLRDPSPEDLIVPQRNIPLGWKEEDNSHVMHLEADNFDAILAAEKSFNVMFYAPWCGHCKTLKPHFTKAAHQIHTEGIEGKMGAVDCTTEESLCRRFQIKGYPTLKYFKNGEFAFDSGHATKDERTLVEFMRNPSRPPPPEKKWSEEEDSGVHHLNSESFKSFLKKKKHVIVMFYAPWCGHCKRVKPEFQGAAKYFEDNPRVEYAAVDCTQNEGLCKSNGVSGYPTIKYFSYFNKYNSPLDYTGGRSQKSFIKFMEDKIKEQDAPRIEL